MLRNETGPESIGGRIRRLRLERQPSQRELASPGVSYAYISRIEAGARRPSVKALRQLAPKLGVSVEYLETGSDLRDALAEGLALQNKDAADETFRRAADLLQEHGHDVDFTDMCRTWARYLRKSGRDSEALDVLDRAAKVNASSRAQTLN